LLLHVVVRTCSLRCVTFGVLAIIASLLLQALTSHGDLNRDETWARREL